MEALLSAAVGAKPLRRADDRVGADLLELRLYLDPTFTAFLNLEAQDLTGLVRAASRGCPLPPQVAVRDATPFRVLCKQRGERLRIALIERFGCRTKLIDHAAEYATRLPAAKRREPEWRRASAGLLSERDRRCLTAAVLAR